MSFFSELKRRSVIRVAIAYGAFAWLIIQVVATVFPLLAVPDRWAPVITIALIAGFPVALILAWIFQLTPSGIVIDEPGSVPESSRIAGRKLDFLIIAALSLALVFVVIDQYVVEEDAFLSAGKRSVAVLPFRNRSLRTNDSFFVDGIHDDILAQLGRISSLDKVISRTSMERYRDTTLSVPEIAEELGVSTILEGGVQRAGDRVRITVQLIDAARDEQLWAGTYDRELTVDSIFDIQTEISLAIANALQATLTDDERRGLAGASISSMEALEQYFLGKDRLHRKTGASLNEAIGFFKKAIELDPNFAPSYVGLALVYNSRRLHAGISWEEELPQARSMIATALELDDELAEAYSALGFLHTISDPAQAAAAFERAIALSPNNVQAYIGYCDLEISYRGRPAAGLTFCERALELDPLSQDAHHQLGIAYSGLGRYADAEKQFHAAIKTDPGSPTIYADLAWLYSFSLGRPGEAIKWFHKSIDRNPDDHVVLAFTGHTYLDLGDADSASHWIGRALQVGPSTFDAQYAKALLEKYLGNEVSALDHARRAFESAPSRGYALALIKDEFLKTGQIDQVRKLYQQYYPDLADDKSPEIYALNLRAAIDFAHVMIANSEHEQARRILDSATEYVRTVPRLSAYNGSDIADVQIAAINGDTELALRLLQQARDDGWVSGWWYFLKHDSLLESIRDEPAFARIVENYEIDMARQLEQIRTWEASGELAQMPVSIH